MAPLPSFTLTDQHGHPHAFPGGRPALLCFVKADCPTCETVMPLLQLASDEFGASVDVWLVAQDEDGGRAIDEAHLPSAPLLDDSALKVSHAYDLEAVPTLVLTDADGGEQRRVVGFGRDEWMALFDNLSHLARVVPPAVEWAGYPAHRPGCGSRTLDPGVAERLAAEAADSPLRARRIEVGQDDDPFEFMFEQGLTDGLPVVPPTPERVLRMLGGTRRASQEVVAIVPPNMAPATVEKIAINAVMAGCKPEYLPVVIAAVEAVCTDRFNIHGVLATTHFVGPVLIVNGPIRDRIGMNYRGNALGQGNRANATIGRALQLVIRNVGGGRPGEIDRAALGQPGKYTSCFAEWEERSNWEPLHVERGFAPTDSTVSVFAGGAPTGFADQLSRTPASLAASYGLMLASATHPKQYRYEEIVAIVSPEHVDTFAKEGWTKAQVREAIQRASARPARELARDDACAEGMSPAEVDRLGPDTLVPKFRAAESIALVVAGGEAGKFGAYVMGWSGTNSLMTTVKIGD